MEIVLTNQPAQRQDLVAALEAFARQHQLAASIRQAADLALEEHLTNIMRYGYKDAQPHEVRVRLGLEEGCLVIEVQDDGPGIPVEHREKVFDRFYRIDVARSREKGGVGLGLAIAKWGAEAHGGRLELHCPSDGGCLFRLLLPVAQASAPDSPILTGRSEILQESFSHGAGRLDV